MIHHGYYYFNFYCLSPSHSAKNLKVILVYIILCLCGSLNLTKTPELGKAVFIFVSQTRTRALGADVRGQRGGRPLESWLCSCMTAPEGSGRWRAARGTWTLAEAGRGFPEQPGGLGPCWASLRGSKPGGT